jgi:long-chain acyl-CoA synthetase
VTGRKKDLTITSSGKNALRETRWISEAVVYGDRKPYLVCIVDPGDPKRAARSAPAGG